MLPQKKHWGVVTQSYAGVASRLRVFAASVVWSCENEEANMAAMKAVWFVCALLCFATIAPFSSPAFADDAGIKKQLEQGAPTFIERFNKQDATGVAAMYASGAIIVDPAGPHTDILKVYEGAFKAGINHMEVKVDQA